MSDAAAPSISPLRRRRLIADLIRATPVLNQEDLVERLAAAGLKVTQATVSRDLTELGAVKVRRGGVQCYALPADLAPTELPAVRLRKVFAEWVESIEAAGNLVILKTPPGSGQMIASALDQANWAEVAGTIAGDDTVMVVVRDGYAPGDLATRFQALATG